jgi:hypothetical protein
VLRHLLKAQAQLAANQLDKTKQPVKNAMAEADSEFDWNIFSNDNK